MYLIKLILKNLKNVDDIISFTYIISNENDFSILITNTGKANRIIIKDKRDDNT